MFSPPRLSRLVLSENYVYVCVCVSNHGKGVAMEQYKNERGVAYP